MSAFDDEKGALVRASSSILARVGSQALARRGLFDLVGVQYGTAPTTVEVEFRDRKRKAIFVVDDEEAVREIICSILTSDGYECRQFAGGVEALAALASGDDCHLLLTDLLNSPMDGATLLQRVKKEFPVIPVIMATAVHDDSVAEFCIREGAYEYLPEPFERDQLLNVIHRALEGEQVLELPRMVPHLWIMPADLEHGFFGCTFCGESNPSQYGKPCPKRTCNTWYEVLGVPESADENHINTAYRELAKEWDPGRLQDHDDVLYDAGYSETQMKWFNVAYYVLGDSVKRQEYDAELERKRSGI